MNNKYLLALEMNNKYLLALIESSKKTESP